MDQDSLKAEFLESYEKYGDELYRFCFFKVSDSEHAEDFVQDTFTRFWQTLRKGDKVENPRALLFMIARNRVIDWYRKKKESSLDVLQEAGFDVLGNSARDVEQPAEMAEVLSAVYTLDEASREVILLRFVEGLTPQEIATMRGESANAVSVRLNRAIKKVQDHMHL